MSKTFNNTSVIAALMVPLVELYIIVLVHLIRLVFFLVTQVVFPIISFVVLGTFNSIKFVVQNPLDVILFLPRLLFLATRYAFRKVIRLLEFLLIETPINIATLLWRGAKGVAAVLTLVFYILPAEAYSAIIQPPLRWLAFKLEERKIHRQRPAYEARIREVAVQAHHNLNAYRRELELYRYNRERHIAVAFNALEKAYRYAPYFHRGPSEAARAEREIRPLIEGVEAESPGRQYNQQAFAAAPEDVQTYIRALYYADMMKRKLKSVKVDLSDLNLKETLKAPNQPAYYRSAASKENNVFHHDKSREEVFNAVLSHLRQLKYDLPLGVSDCVNPPELNPPLDESRYVGLVEAVRGARGLPSFPLKSKNYHAFLSDPEEIAYGKTIKLPSASGKPDIREHQENPKFSDPIT